MRTKKSVPAFPHGDANLKTPPEFSLTSCGRAEVDRPHSPMLIHVDLSAPFEGGQLAAAKLLRLPDVSSRLGMGRTLIYDLVKHGKFPAPVKIGRTSAWVDLEVTAWMAERMAARPALGRPA